MAVSVNSRQGIVLGSEVKLSVSLGPVNGMKMGQYDFVCKFFVHPSKVVELTKAQMRKVSDDEYLACFDTTPLCFTGRLMMMAKAEIPDSDFNDGRRTDWDKYETSFIIIQNGLL